jgi:hypothetical protein
MKTNVNVKKDKKLLFKKKDEYIEPELRPEYVEKIKRMEKDNKKLVKYDF